MSTIHFSCPEWGAIVTGWVASGALPFPQAIHVAGLAARSNAKAYAERYSETVPPEDIPSADEIEAAALPILAKPETWLSMRHVGGVVYNCAEDPNIETPVEELGGQSLADFLDPIENAARKWLDGLKAAKRRREENDAAFKEEGPLPVVPWSNIAAMAQAKGCARIIIADFGVNESDSQSDYYGGRTARTVVIGFGKGTRENFRELRKAAAAFPPAEDIAFDRITVRCLFKCDNDPHGRYESLRGDDYRDRSFRTEDEARAFVTDLVANAPETQPGYSGSIGFPSFAKSFPDSVEYVRHSPENRENYSMGGGNYLGWSRYGGWTVYSVPVDWHKNNQGGSEFFEAPAIVSGGKTITKAPAIPRKPAKPAIPFPIWTKRGILQKSDTTIDWPHVYRKPETAQKDVDRLASMGIVAEVTEGRGRAAYFVRLVSQPAAVVAPEVKPEPVVTRFDALANC